MVGAVVLLILAMRWFGEGHAEQPAAASEFLCTMAIAEKAVIADVMEALGQDMQKKTTDELIGGEGHDLRLVMMAIILPGETHVAVVDVSQAIIGNGDPVRIASNILRICSGPAKGGLV